jgi:hypothetical protein
MYIRKLGGAMTLVVKPTLLAFRTQRLPQISFDRSKSSWVKKSFSDVVALLKPTYAWTFNARVTDGKERPCTL